MHLHFFTIPVLQSEAASAELNHLLASQRVANVEKQFVAQGAQSCWAVCVTTVGPALGAAGSASVAAHKPQAERASRRSVVDYREVLSPDEFALYDKPRQLRKAAAEADGLPTYAVFTNEQLATMVRQRVGTAASLGQISGVGQGRVGRYGPQFLPLLQAGLAAMPQPMPER